MSTAVEIKKLNITFAGNFTAIDDISFELPTGKITGFIGPSGAGKTTLIRAIVGRHKITKGSITVFGLPAGSAKLRQHMSYMTQELSVYADLTVQQNLRYFAAMFGIKHRDIPKLITGLLKTTDMDQQVNQLVSSLSSGQKQRVSLAIALIGYPKLMVLDEPTVGLDPVLREQIWQLFRTLAAGGTTLIVSSHVMDEAERCDNLVLIRDGKILAHGSPESLCHQTGTKNVEQSFLSLVRQQP
jgi:ABC-2 type transport system ATP-binding protein